ncbi:tax1-binding protein 1 homolog B isoform X2 [Pangasianodon hypophthalmus]|uniref:tax1-binding protein 1 homolog B isoform X2 n=1 Tax=Pangasianodon hypophthalmus TaxID=310915 RepID=UPI0023072F4E|nr:tax1-binding protein 1 homolog B isoform X2 [Pangasianodon hypophthalmus]
METSNFAHVIFQNVGKSYLPHAALECHYTLTQFIKPHPKDWVGIFKVGWSTARDYYTFLWSPLPDVYTEGTAVNRSVIFQGYYVPNDDGEFYQFCYVTHKGEIRGASTPFQFRANSPTEEELLTVEDEGGSDILVVTTKASYLEQKMEEVRLEKEELLKSMELLQKERNELLEERDRIQKEYEQERENTAQLRKEVQELQLSSQSLQEEREEVKKRMEENTARLLQLEEDLIGVTQKGLQKETELDCLKDRVKKLTLEKEALESQLKNEKDEKELYKIHLKNRELENTKLSAELQMLRSVDVNKENTIAQLKEELARAKACLAEKDKQHRQLLANSSPSGESKALREQLRQKEEQLQATQQQANMLSAELRDSSSARDRSMAELYRVKLESDTLRQSQAEARAECSRLEKQVEEMKNSATQEARKESEDLAVAELQREVEDLKLRLQMAAEHYKEKYKECQKLQKQVVKLSEQQGAKRSPGLDAATGPLSASPEASVPGSPGSSDNVLDAIIQGKLKGVSKDVFDKSDKYKKCKQMLCEEKGRNSMLMDELAKLELKWKEQVKINESLKLQLAAEEDRYKSQVAAKGRELKELKDSLAALSKEKEKLEGELQRSASREEEEEDDGSLDVPPVFLQYPLPYQPDVPSPLLMAQRPTELMFGNPYSSESRDSADGEFSDDQMPRLPPVGPPSWDSNVVCSQPARNLSRPDGLEEPEEQPNTQTNNQATVSEPPTHFLNDGQMPFCFETSEELQKRCPLCEVIFPPNYDQSKFEEHVESHWKVCPMCSEQFPLDCDQQLFEKHVLTHFDGNVLNFD